MSRAHEGVPVAQLPGTELVAYLMAQPPVNAVDPSYSEYAAVSPDEQAANEQRMREMILTQGYDAAAQQVYQPQPAAAQGGERRGFFGRLFGR